MNDEAHTLLGDPSARLESAFRSIHERHMRDLPFVNPALGVKAVAFEPWKGYWLGVMVTPWSMNLMLTPRDAQAWRPLAYGEKRRYALPAGAFDFISANTGDIGEHLVCSLFSPVLEFVDHASACETARLARAALFDAHHAEPTEGIAGQPEPATQREGHATEAAPGPIARLEAALHAPVSRRDLLRGRFVGEGDEPAK